MQSQLYWLLYKLKYSFQSKILLSFKFHSTDEPIVRLYLLLNFSEQSFGLYMYVIVRGH